MGFSLRHLKDLQNQFKLRSYLINISSTVNGYGEIYREKERDSPLPGGPAHCGELYIIGGSLIFYIQ